MGGGAGSSKARGPVRSCWLLGAPQRLCGFPQYAPPPALLGQSAVSTYQWDAPVDTPAVAASFSPLTGNKVSADRNVPVSVISQKE